MPSRASSQVLTDHNEIRRWAEQRGAKPSAVQRTGGGNDIGMIRLDFPGYSGAGSLEEVSWDDWFEKFDESNLALIVQEKTARGQTSNFNKLISRDSATETSSQSSRRSTNQKKAAGRSSSTRASKTTSRSSRRTSGGTRIFGRTKSRTARRTLAQSSKSRSSGRRSAQSSRKKSSSTSNRRSSTSAMKRSPGSARAKRAQSVRGRNNRSSGRRAA